MYHRPTNTPFGIVYMGRPLKGVDKKCKYLCEIILSPFCSAEKNKSSFLVLNIGCDLVVVFTNCGDFLEIRNPLRVALQDIVL